MYEYNVIQEKIATLGVDALTESELAYWQITEHDRLVTEVRDFSKQMGELAVIHGLTEFVSELESHQVNSGEPVSQKKLDKSKEDVQRQIKKMENLKNKLAGKAKKADAKLDKFLENPQNAAAYAVYAPGIRSEELERTRKFVERSEALGEITMLSISRIANVSEINDIETAYPNLPYNLYLTDEENFLKPTSQKNK